MDHAHRHQLQVAIRQHCRPLKRGQKTLLSISSRTLVHDFLRPVKAADAGGAVRRTCLIHIPNRHHIGNAITHVERGIIVLIKKPRVFSLSQRGNCSSQSPKNCLGVWPARSDLFNLEQPAAHTRDAPTKAVNRDLITTSALTPC